MKHQITNHKAEAYGISAILFASLLWGTTGTAASFAPSISPLAVGAFSMGVGGLLLAVFAFRNLARERRLIAENFKILLFGALALAVYPMAFYSSMRLSGVAIGTVVSIASAPFFVAALERLFSKNNQIDRRWVYSLLLGTVGIALLTFAEPVSQVAKETNYHYLGIALGLIAGLSYALYAWAAKELITHGVSSTSAMGSIFGCGAMLLLPTLLFTGENLFATTTNTAVVLYMALIPMFIGYVCFGYGLRVVAASKASLLTLFEPAVAAVFAVVVVGEHIAVSGWIGVLLIMGCLFLQAYKPVPNKSEANEVTC